MANPRGIALAGDERIYVADSGDPSLPFPGKVLEIKETGIVTSILEPFSAFSAVMHGETYVFGVSDVASSSGVIYVLMGLGAFLQQPLHAENHLLAISPVGEISDLFNLTGFESEYDPDGAGIDSNATGVAVTGDGLLWITDAAGNWAAQLSRIKEGDKHAEVATITVFPAVDGEDAVPTGVAIGSDGNAYVALFRCQQPTAGKGGIARVLPDGSYDIVVTGLSNPIDVAFDASGTMYVLEFAIDYAPATGRLFVVKNDGSLTPVLEQLSFPTSLAINEQGDVYVTEIASPAGGSEGTGRLLVFESLISPAIE